jgi:hypothetical protein
MNKKEEEEASSLGFMIQTIQSIKNLILFLLL